MTQTAEVRYAPTVGGSLVSEIKERADELFVLATEADTQARLLRKCLELTASAGKPLAAEWEARQGDPAVHYENGDRPVQVVLQLDQWKKLVHALRTIERHLR